MRKHRKTKGILPLILFIIVATSTGAFAVDKATAFASVDAGIKALKVAPDVRAGYARSLFKHWSDLDKNGCNTRNDVIIQEALEKPKVEADCKIVKDTGKWYSAYEGLTITNFSALDVDHFVPLAEAWDSGASKWDAAKREQYANDMGDPVSLIAVSAATNRSKSDQDPGDWLPVLANYHCAYIKQWVQVKIRWSLTVDEKELKVLKDVNAKCPKSKISVVIVK
jgi:hypothetical protein